MARIYAHCHRCGCLVDGGVARNRAEADRIAGWKRFTCADCLDVIRQAETAQAAEFNAVRGLPSLQGTPAQIAWAEVVRAKFIGEIETLLRQRLRVTDDMEREAHRAFDLPVGFKQAWDRLLDALAILEANDDAHWWIEKRMWRAADLVADVATKVPTGEALLVQQIEAAFEKSVQESTTLVPPGALVSSIAVEISISIREQAVEACFPDRQEKFRELIKSMGYTWDQAASRWFRAITAFSGPVDERAVELGHRLLQAGFKVCLQDGVLRERVVSAGYQPERKRWVMKRSGGKYDGWFAIHWTAGDYYEQARKLPGSRWEKPFVCVPAQAFEAVQDFAQLYGFSISDGAKGVIEAASVAYKAQRLGAVAEHKGADKPDGLKAILETPVEVPDALLD